MEISITRNTPTPQQLVRFIEGIGSNASEKADVQLFSFVKQTMLEMYEALIDSDELSPWKSLKDDAQIPDDETFKGMNRCDDPIAFDIADFVYRSIEDWIDSQEDFQGSYDVPTHDILKFGILYVECLRHQFSSKKMVKWLEDSFPGYFDYYDYVGNGGDYCWSWSDKGEDYYDENWTD